MRQPSDPSKTLAGEGSFTLGEGGPYPSQPKSPAPHQVQIRLEAMDGRALNGHSGQEMAFLGQVTALGEAVQTLRLGDRILGESPHPLGTHITLNADRLRQAPEGQGAMDALGRAITGDRRHLDVWGIARTLRAGHTPKEPIILSFRDAWAMPLEARPIENLLDPEGRYVISGGDKEGNGWILEWAIARGARHVICLGFAEPGNNVSNTLKELRGAGASCRYLALDPGTNPGAYLIKDILSDDTIPLMEIFHGIRGDGREGARVKTLEDIGGADALTLCSTEALGQCEDDLSRFALMDGWYRGQTRPAVDAIEARSKT